MHFSVALALALACTWVLYQAVHADFRHVAPGLPADLVEHETRIGVAASLCFLEGPAVDADGMVYFSDIAGNRILKLDAFGQISVFREDSGRTNGNTFDAQGRLISCEGAEMGPGGRRRLVRTNLATGRNEVLADRYQGKRLNSPNDVCVDVHGRIWFTDPRYAIDRSDLELDHESVYRLDPDGTLSVVISQPDVQRPNGIAITPDARTLYLVDSHPAVGGNRKIWAFSVGQNGQLATQRMVYDFAPGRGGDGMRLDVNGNLWVCAGIARPRGPGETTDVPPGVYVMTPEGKLLGCIPIPEDVITNCAFGGMKRTMLYVTAGKTLYAMPTRIQGYALYPEIPCP